MILLVLTVAVRSRARRTARSTETGSDTVEPTAAPERGSVSATEPARRRGLVVSADHVLSLNARWQPVFETVTRIGAVSWVLTSLASCLLLNAYLGAIGQSGIPLDLAGTWSILILLGALLIATLVTLVIPFTGAERMMAMVHDPAPGMDGSVVPAGTRCIFLISASTSLALLLWGMLAGIEVGVASGLGLALVPGLAFGLGALWWRKPDRLTANAAKILLMLVLWIASALLMFLQFAAILDSVLRLNLADNQPVWIALTVAMILLVMGCFLKRSWIMAAAAIGLSWLIIFVAPGPRVLVLNGLYMSNIGGGVPASILLDPLSPRICNLGIADRPVLYLATKDCSKREALDHLAAIVDTRSMAARSAVIRRWQAEIDAAKKKAR